MMSETMAVNQYVMEVNNDTSPSEVAKTILRVVSEPRCFEVFVVIIFVVVAGNVR